MIKEQNMLEAYGMMEDYCNLLVERVHLLEQERSLLFLSDFQSSSERFKLSSFDCILISFCGLQGMP